jgi:hypothetical protein
MSSQDRNKKNVLLPFFESFVRRRRLLRHFEHWQTLLGAKPAAGGSAALPLQLSALAVVKQSVEIILLEKSLMVFDEGADAGPAHLRQHAQLRQDDRQFQFQQCPFGIDRFGWQ